MLLSVIKRSVYGFTSASEAEDQKANTGLCTLSLYLLDMSHNSSHLRINSINVSSILKTKTDSTRCKQTLEVQCSRR